MSNRKKKDEITSVSPAIRKADVSGSFPSTMECHCMATAHKYRQRCFTNQLGHTVTRIFYRCENCRSRIHSDFIPELDSKTVDVFELLKNYR